MTVYFDLLGAQNRDHGERGIARLISQLVLAMEREHPTAIDHYIVHPHLPIPESIEPLVSTGKVIRSGYLQARPMDGGTFIAGSLIELEEPMGTVLPAWARGPGWTSYAILYDLIPLRFKDQYLSDDLLRSKYLDRVAGYGMFDHLLPISEASLHDAVDLLNFPAARQQVIYAGVDDRFVPATPGGDPPPIDGLRPNYVLFPTGIDWRKNVDRMIDAYGSLDSQLRSRHQLVLACRLDPWVEEVLRERARSHKIEDDQLLMPGYLTDDELVALNQHAIAAIFPSLYEGFGLPVLEAMQCGVPVICADNSSLQEVQPHEPARFDGTSTDEIANALTRILTDESFRTDVLASQQPNFTWERSAALLIEALGSGQPKPQRPRLAVVTPLPPQASGIAQYSARLLPELAKLADVAVFTSTNDEEGEVNFAPVAGCEVQPLSDLETIHSGGRPFDRILYMMGNSRFHVEALKSLRRTGGAVMFHDARLTGLYNETYRIDPNALDASFVGDALDQMYPQRYRPAVVESHTIAPDTAHRFGILMGADVARAASHRLCHSTYAKSLLELDTGLAVEHAFDLPVPPASGSSPNRAKATVASFGIVDRAKSPELLIQACAQVDRPGVTLRFVGECDPKLWGELDLLAKSLGVAVECTGHLSDDDFLTEQRTAAVAVQLRRFSNGESSGAMAELIALGTPLISNRVGPVGELPEGVCLTVPADPNASETASAIKTVLAEPHERLRMAEAAGRYAEANTYANAAQSLLIALDLT